MTFADEEEQELLTKLFHKRMNLVNPLHCDLNFDLDIEKCPPEDGNDEWDSYALKDLPELRKKFLNIPIPQLKPEQLRALLFWILSPYRCVRFSYSK